MGENGHLAFGKFDFWEWEGGNPQRALAETPEMARWDRMGMCPPLQITLGWL